MKKLMFNIPAGIPRVFQAPASAPDGDDFGGGGGGDDDPENPDGGDDDDDDDDPEETDDGDDGDDDDDPENPDDGDDDDDDKDGELGERAQKRIKKLIAERKEATAKLDAVQKQLDEAKKLAGDDGKAMIKAAEVSGILPGLMTKDEAEAFRDLADYPRVIEGLEDWLDDHNEDDEYETGGKTLTFGQVKKRLRKLRGEYADLKHEYGPRQKELKAKVREIFELGVAAQKAGWKPDGSESKPAKKKKLKTKPTATKPAGITRKAGRAEEIEVEDEDSLEAFIMADRRKKN